MSNSTSFHTSTAKEQIRQLEKTALQAEWDIPEGRLGGIVRQQRFRARTSLRRASRLFSLLCTVIFLGLAFYLLLPFWKQYVDGKRGSLEATLTTINAQSKRMDAERSNLIGQPNTKGLLQDLQASFEVIKSGTNEDILGHIITGSNILLYGKKGLLLTSNDGGKVLRVSRSKQKMTYKPA